MTRKGRLLLPADLGIESLATIRARLAPKLRNRRAVCLDGAEVRRVHTDSLQLLCAFAGERAAQGRETRIEAPSEPLLDAMRLTGTAVLLGDGSSEQLKGA